MCWQVSFSAHAFDFIFIIGKSNCVFFLSVSTECVVTTKIVFPNVIFKVEMKSVSVLLVTEQSSDTKHSELACLIH